MFSLFRKPIFSFSLFPRVIDGCLPFILYIIYYIQDYFLYYILVCLSKVFQRTVFSFVLPFQRESVCKGKAFFRNLQIFSKVFLKKFSEGSQKACGLSFLAPLHIRKVRYSVQQSALSPVASALPVCHLQRLSLSKAVAKVQTFSVSATFTPYFFAEIFQVLA
mgnify:CR=1 FL=1